jgi:hypothetical protein
MWDRHHGPISRQEYDEKTSNFIEFSIPSRSSCRQFGAEASPHIKRAIAAIRLNKSMAKARANA